MTSATPFRIKVCGLTNAEDAALAARLGADALGVVFWPDSPRAVDETAAARALAGAPGVVRVGVFVDAPLEVVRRAVDACALDAVQLAGQESPAYARALADDRGVRVLRAVHVEDARALARFADYPADSFLLDASSRFAPGGTGRTFDWAHARALPWPRDRVILAGGLRASNVARALATVPAHAVDVCSGVEIAPGRKDPAALEAFITAARSSFAATDSTLENAS